MGDNRGVSMGLAEQVVTESQVKVSSMLDRPEPLWSILDSILAGVVLIDKQTRKVVAANATACRLLGLDVQQVFGMPYQGFDIDIGSGPQQTCLRGLAVLADRREVHIDGKAYIVDSFVDLGKVKADQAGQADIVQKLELANKELTDFAYVVSHDLKAPLRGIKSLASWIATDYADRLDDEGKANIKLLLDRVARLENLIDGILQYSRAARPSDQEEPVDLAELVPAVVDLLSPPSHITITIDQPLPKVKADKTRLSQVFQNLLSNAIKFMDKPNGLIRIGCLDDGAYWRFFVSDNGPGIESRHFDRIFQLFQTLAPKDQSNSTGVGLAVVKKIVTFYGGKIWVESEVGKGSTFFFTLPKADQADKAKT